MNESQVSLSRLVQVIEAAGEPSGQSDGGRSQTAALLNQPLHRSRSQIQNQVNMKLCVRTFFCLFCGAAAAAAAAAAHDFNWNIQPPAGRFGDQRPNQHEVQVPAGRPDPHHRNHFNTVYLLVKLIKL